MEKKPPVFLRKLHCDDGTGAVTANMGGTVLPVVSCV